MMRVVIRADAGPAIGSGHVMRCLALAEALRARGATVHMIAAGAPARAAAALERIGATLTTRAAATADDAADVIAATEIGHADGRAVVVDGYHFGRDYMRALRGAGAQVIWIDDLNALGRFECDLVVNPTLGAERCSYETGEGARVLVGGTYAMLRDDVRAMAERQLSRMRRIVIALGGADPQQLTAHVLRAVRAARVPDAEIIAVVGPSNPGNAEVAAAAAGCPQVSVVQDPPDFASLLAHSTLVITGAGTMAWELAALGVPSILLVVADNQRRGASAMREAEAAEVLDASRAADLATLTDTVHGLWTDASRREALTVRGRRVIDGRGASRIARWIVDGPRPDAVRMRPATAEDALQVWRISSDPLVRSRSFDPSPIPLVRHFDWFDRLLASGRSRLYVFAVEDEVAAQIRYDRVDAGAVELSFAVASPFRRLRLGTRLLTDTWQAACRDLDVREVRGLVIRDNGPSVEAFRRAGFVQAGTETREGRECIVFAKRAA